MATEVADWDTTDKDNTSPIPPGPDGNRPARINLGIVELMGSIARWRDGGLVQVAAPASAGATGTAGTLAYDGSYIYICSDTDTWLRVAVATW